MGYPEPIPELKGRKAKEFLKRLENFKLTSEQKKRWENSEKIYEALSQGKKHK